MTSFTHEQKEKVKNTSRKVRNHRRIHRYLGIVILVFMVISAGTGIILSWKKQIDVIQPPTHKVETNITEWMSASQLAEIADQQMSHLPDIVSAGIDRMDFRPEKGIVKVIYSKGYWEVQLNASTGEVLSIERRLSDFFEKLHDGSIISEGVKLITMNGLGVAILLMTLSGFWLWFGPRRIKKIKAKS